MKATLKCILKADWPRTKAARLARLQEEKKLPAGMTKKVKDGGKFTDADWSAYNSLVAKQTEAWREETEVPRPLFRVQAGRTYLDITSAGRIDLIEQIGSGTACPIDPHGRSWGDVLRAIMLDPWKAAQAFKPDMAERLVPPTKGRPVTKTTDDTVDLAALDGLLD